MATKTVKEPTVVEQTRKITTCDYCQLVTDEDIEDDEEFGRILLNPSLILDSLDYQKKYLADRLIRAETEAEVMTVLREMERQMMYAEDAAADLCPGCANALFGDHPATGIRRGTGYLNYV